MNAIRPYEEPTQWDKLVTVTKQWWFYHYGTHDYFTAHSADETTARAVAVANGWQFDGEATCKC